MSFLETMIEQRITRVRADFGSLSQAELESLAACGRESLLYADLDSLRDREDVAVIAEVKKSSPSEGVLSAECDPAARARQYQRGGAAAISVLTEPEYFGGSFADLTDVVDAVRLPVLCKDFVVDPVQLYMARASGADAVLLMVSVLGERLSEYMDLAVRLRIGYVVEVADLDELDMASAAGARAIGVNARNFTTLALDRGHQLMVVEEAAACCDALVIAASGIRDRADVEAAASAGAHAVLVGETLMRSPDPMKTLNELTGVRKGERP
jgi:indole-3-glycerol phosphate synthase